jgi:hypothetical protein
MNFTELSQKIKQISQEINHALNELEKNKNSSFFKTFLQQKSIELYEATLSLDTETHIKNEEANIQIESLPVLEEIEPTPESVVIHTNTEPIVQKHEEQIPKTHIEEPVHAVEDNDQISLNEKLSKTKISTQNYAEKSKETPISDLLKAISISKKFEFINGLFDGNSEAYKTCINTIQNAESYESAIEYLEQDVLVNFNWDENEKLASELFLLIKRRFNQY